MKFFIYANGMPFDGHTLEKGQSLGGSETMALLTAKELAARKHEVILFSNMQSQPGAKVDGVYHQPIGRSDQKKFPFGHIFESFARDVPSDVILAQRTAGVFGKPYNSKLNYFWAHDLALKRFQPQMNAMSWNVDRFLGVSEFHKKQIIDVYGLPEHIVHSMQNGIDLNLWKTQVDPEKKIASKVMLYAARPERGLINLVKENGIMEKLLKIDPEIKLMVCTYTGSHPSMEGLYNYLYNRCQQLPNVENIGAQSHQQLAEIEKNCWLYVYPTEFEDTSCLMVMQNAAAGTPFITTKVGALEETGKGSGVYWSTIEQFHEVIKYLSKNPHKWMQLHKRALEKAPSYGIGHTVDILEGYIVEDLQRLTSDKQKLYDHFVYTSDIYAADKLKESTEEIIKENPLRAKYVTDVEFLKDTNEFYVKSAKRNFEIGAQHGMHNPANLLGMARMQPVIELLSKLSPDAHVLDYGCCVGQMAFALKTRFPDMNFVCADISQEQLDVGIEYAEKNNISGMQFKQCIAPSQLDEKAFDVVLALEVVEHIWEFRPFLDALTKCVKRNGKIVISTPFGPFEQNSEDPDPMYQHLHNFEASDIIDIIGKKKNPNIVYVGDQPSKRGECLGNYVWSWTETHVESVGDINWERKFEVQRPREQVSACLIIRPDGRTLGRCLESIAPLVDELIIGVDDSDWDSEWEEKNYKTYIEHTKKLAYQIGAQYNAKFIYIKPPLEQGFAEARNKTIEKATKDWVLWIDDDETFVYADRFRRFLRSNMFNCYSIDHHHITAEPVGVLKTDHPTRVFRNHKNIRFYGVVHEHPETEINEGPGRTFVVPGPLGCIMHYGYETEMIRRKRFVRNFPLMQRDRQLNPERKLGKFLWIRDLAHMNRFIMEKNGGQVTPEIIQNCKDAIVIWRGELMNTNIRMLQDSLQYISEAVLLLTNNQGIHFKLSLDINSRGIGDNLQVPMQPIFQGVVENKKDIKLLQEVLLRDKLNMAETSQVYI